MLPLNPGASSGAQHNDRMEQTGSKDIQHQVEVWIVDLAVNSEVLQQALTLLSRHEIETSNRLKFENLKNRYVVAHAVLRTLLAHYLQVLPQDLHFTCGPNGKPSLTHFPQLRFNMSHSGTVAAFAFTSNCEIGIDLEGMRHVSDLPQIASNFFSEAEKLDLAQVSGTAFEQAFYRGWVRKEAYVKAIGAGLLLAFASFRVSLLPNAPPRLLAISQGDAGAWALHSFKVGAHYVGAVAYRDRSRGISFLPRTDAARILATRSLPSV